MYQLHGQSTLDFRKIMPLFKGKKSHAANKSCIQTLVNMNKFSPETELLKYKPQSHTGKSLYCFTKSYTVYKMILFVYQVVTSIPGMIFKAVELLESTGQFNIIRYTRTNVTKREILAKSSTAV